MGEQRPEQPSGLSRDRLILTPFMTAVFISNIGRTAFFAGMSWSVLVRTDSVAIVSWLLLTSSVAIFLSSSVLGHAADTLDKRRLAVWLETIRAAILTMTGLVEIEGAGLWVLFTSVALYSVADRGNLITTQTMIPHLVHRDRAVKANSAFYLMMQSGNFVGALGVVMLLHHMPHGAVLLANALLFGISALLLTTIRYRGSVGLKGQATAPSGTRWYPSIVGIAQRPLVGITGFYCLASAAAILINVLLAGYVSKELKGDVLLFGRAESAWALGAIIACLALAIDIGSKLIKAGPPPLIFALGLGLLALQVLPGPNLAILILMFLGALYNLCRVSVDVLLQRAVYPPSLGRMKGALETISAGFGLFVYLAIALIAERASASTIFTCYGIMMVLVAGMTMLSSRSRWRTQGHTGEGSD